MGRERGWEVSSVDTAHHTPHHTQHTLIPCLSIHVHSSAAAIVAFMAMISIPLHTWHTCEARNEVIGEDKVEGGVRTYVSCGIWS